jgi:acetylornithine deacetylase/succinyl-diaminopimelate desuccinylase-like protein
MQSKKPSHPAIPVARALFAALAVSMTASAAPTPGPLPPAANQQLARDLLRELVEIRSVHDVGTRETAAVIAARLRANGFGEDEVRVLPQDKYPQQVSVVARLRGRGLGKPVMWICHMDVVEARPEDWSLPPFQLTEKDGWFYGRGTLDMKDQCAAMVAGLVRLRQEGYVPDRDIITAFTADEEVGLEQDGLDDLLSRHRELVDAGLVINPDDHCGRLVQGRRLTLDVETSEKTYVTFTLETTSDGGHSSEPRPDNAIYRLAHGLTRLEQYQFPFRTNPTTRLYFQRVAAFESGQRRADMLAVARGTVPDAAAAARLARDVPLNSILHTTCVATMLSGGHQENALPQRARATVQCRVMPGETVEQTQAALVHAAADPGIRVQLAAPVVPAPESPPTPEFLGSVERVANSMWPGVTVIPTMAAGASDSIYTRAAGMPSYIVNGTWEDFEDDRRHGRDERREVSVFYENLEFTYRLMKELSSGQP